METTTPSSATTAEPVPTQGTDHRRRQEESMMIKPPKDENPAVPTLEPKPYQISEAGTRIIHFSWLTIIKLHKQYILGNQF